MRLGLTIAILLCACSSSDGGAGTDASTIAGDGGGVADAAPRRADAAAAVSSCPDGQLATAVGASGDLMCASIDDATAVAVRSRCSVYLGQRDSCDGCTDPPTKWSSSGPLGCSAGVGAGNTCLPATLDASSVELATLDLDGDVNDDDKLYTTLHCITAPRASQPAPCAPGWAITGRSGDSWSCAPVSEAAIGYIRTHCAVYLGWQDKCDDCTTAPTKWGFANDSGCTNGAGTDDTCVTTTLDGETVNLFGLNTDGDVDDNDKLHLGLYCDPPDATPGSAKDQCPEGQFVVGTNDDGTLQCADAAATVADYLDAHCSLFFGWHDSCDACTEPPTKWGQVGTASCANGTGTNDTCTDQTLGGATVHMFGLNTDGDVNSDDTLYFDFRCDG